MKSVPPQRGPRREKHFQEDRIDPYQTRVKFADPALCPQCEAIYVKGRWKWGTRPPGAQPQLCPACRRTNEKAPAGTILLSGSYLMAHKDELLHIARNQEADEKTNHPLNRIMAIEAKPDAIQITTTDIHLPRRIGHALEHAHKGELSIDYAPSEYSVRVAWSRDL